ncbi:MAG TPA: chloride channel protein, partial [Egibacteraceae bacterium]|nr:chloride channel protein [Egibacteraceae bacterium]
MSAAGWARSLARLAVVRRVRRLAADSRTAEPLLLALAVAVGLGTGLLAVGLIEGVELVQRLAWGGDIPPWRVVAVPAAGALLVGVLVTYWMPEARGGGVGEVMTSIALHGGRMRPGLALGKLATSALNLGTGASGGREGPITQIGGSVGSSIGRLLALDEEQKRALIAAGAGAGIAASFNAPIGGMLFALEVILGGFRARYLQVVVVASVVASVTAREIVGPELIYDPPPYRLGDPRELLLYAVLGLAAAAVGIAYIRGEDAVGIWVQRLRLWPPLRLAVGGLGVGVIALVVPEVLGTGDRLPAVPGTMREPIADMLAGGGGGIAGDGAGAWTLAGLLLVLLAAKLLATVLTLGTGNSAGSFSPAVFLGAALGGAFGHAAVTLLPASEVSPGAFALVGMAGVLGASVRAPLTAILLAFELTGDYGMVLPLMLTTGIATMIADRLQPESLYTLPLRRRGIVYGEPEDVDIMQTVQVAEIMTREPVTVPADLPLRELHERFRRTRLHGFPVVDGDRLVGVVTLADLNRVAETTGDLMAQGGPGEGLRASDICTRNPLTVTPGDPVFRAV